MKKHSPSRWTIPAAAALLASMCWSPVPLFAQETIPIYACISVPAGAYSTVARYQELAEAGFTTSLSGFDNVEQLLVALDAAQAAGVTIWAFCPELESNPALTVSRLKNHPALAGYHIIDEPSAAAFTALGDRVRTLQALDSTHPCYINLLPIYASPSLLGTGSYQEYIDRFVDTVPVPFLSFDHYPTASGTLDEGVYTNLEIVAAKGRVVSKPFWGFYQSTLWDLTQPQRTISELRLECFNNLVYGAQGIQAYTYWANFPDDRDAPIDPQGNRTSSYAMVQTVNREVTSLSRVFLGAKNFEVFHAGQTSPAGTRPFAAQGGLTSLNFDPGVGLRSAVVSYFTNAGSNYVAIVNKDIDHAVSLAVGFADAATTTEVRKDGADRAVSGGNFTIKAGDILVFKVNDSTPVNHPPVVSLTIPASGVAGVPLEMSASASDVDGTIVKVDFFVGSVLIGTDTTEPYTATWNVPGLGVGYQVSAQATDNLGAMTVSSVKIVNITNPPPKSDGTGLMGAYFTNTTVAGTPLTRTDGTVNFAWGNGSPASSIPVDGFSVRWTGQVQAQFSETYTFTTLSDDGVRLWVNGQQLINNWTDHGPTENSGSITLVAGEKYDLTMEYFENGGGAVATLSWASPSTAKQIIPSTQLFPSTPGALPAGWSAQDIGSVSVAGSTALNNGTWTVIGSGADIWNTADGCQFVSQRLTGDVQVTALVSGLTNTNGWAKAGVMIRESLTAGSRHASTFATAANGLTYQRRVTTDGASRHTAGPGSPAPYWVRIARLGNVVISSSSPNGTTWTEIRRETIAMSAAVYVGLAVTSHNNGVVCTATFANVQVVGVAAAAN